MAKTEKLYHPATGLYHDIEVDYVPAHLSNGWVRKETEKPEEPVKEEPKAGKKK